MALLSFIMALHFGSPRSWGLLQADFTPTARLLHAYFTPTSRLLHAYFTPIFPGSYFAGAGTRGCGRRTPTSGLFSRASTLRGPELGGEAGVSRAHFGRTLPFCYGWVASKKSVFVRVSVRACTCLCTCVYVQLRGKTTMHHGESEPVRDSREAADLK